MLGFDYIWNRSVDRFHFYEISLQKSIHQMHNELLIYRESNFMYGSYTIGVDERNFISVVLIDWLVFNVQRAIFQLYTGREHLKNWSATGLETRKGDG